jgi:hypothetical protein
MRCKYLPKLGSGTGTLRELYDVLFDHWELYGNSIDREHLSNFS